MTLYDTLLRVLEEHESLCMDDEKDRRKLAEAITCALEDGPWRAVDTKWLKTLLARRKR